MAKGKANRAKQPGTVKPRISKMYDGRNVATRPIPIITYESDRRAIAAASSDQKPKHKAVNMPSGPRPGGIEVISGSKVSGSKGLKAGTYNPATGLLHTPD